MEWGTLPKYAKLTIYIAASIFVAAWVVLDLFDGYGTIKRWWQGSRPYIEVRSPKRPDAAEFRTQEKVSLVLRNSNAVNVIWLIDKREAVPGGVTVAEYLFPRRAHLKLGEMHNRRVDAFIEVGDAWDVTYTTVKVEESAEFSGNLSKQGNELTLATPQAPATGGELESVVLSAYENGRFVEKLRLVKGPKSAAAGKVLWSSAATSAETLRTLLEKGVWAEYTFRQANSQGELVLLQPIAGHVAE